MRALYPAHNDSATATANFPPLAYGVRQSAQPCASPLGIPTTLHDALMARLDRLGAAKEIAQLGATLGREFDYALLQAVSPLSEDLLQQGLRQLVETELGFQSGIPPHARYLFKHALIQDTAYQSLLKSKRQYLHQQVARILEERFPDLKETQPELLAHHYTEAGLTAQAVPYWQKAGQGAAERSAHVEAINHLSKGLELLTTLPDTPERVQQELTLQLTLGASQVITKGYAAREVEHTYSRARELCRQVGETPQLFTALGGLWQFHIVRAECQTARELGELVLSLAQNMRDPDFLVEAYDTLGQTSCFMGELGQAQAHLEQSILLYDPQHHRALTLLCAGEDPGVACRSFAAWNLWSLGYPDQALMMSHAALTLAQEIAHPFSLALSLTCTAVVHIFRGERPAAQERAEAGMTLCREQEFAFYLSFGTILRGWVLAEQGQREEGMAQMRQGLAAYRATEAELFRPYFLALLAEVCGKVGQTEEGLTTLAETLATVDKTGERFYEAELYRLRGELTLQKAGTRGWGLGTGSTSSQAPSLKPQDPKEVEREAEACFLKAIEIARRQQAKSLELCATMSLSRLWQSQGKKAEAHQMLAEIYNWFTEGFDTKDLQEAKALIEELSH